MKPQLGWKAQDAIGHIRCARDGLVVVTLSVPILSLLALMFAGGAIRRSHKLALKSIKMETDRELSIANHVRFGSSIETVMSLVPKGAWLGRAARAPRLRKNGQYIYVRWDHHSFRGYFMNGCLVYGNESVFLQFNPPGTLWDGADVCVPGTSPPPNSPEFDPTVYWVGGDRYDAFGKPCGDDFREANRR